MLMKIVMYMVIRKEMILDFEFNNGNIFCKKHDI